MQIAGTDHQVLEKLPFQLKGPLLRHGVLQGVVQNVDARRVRPDRARTGKGIEHCWRVTRKTSIGQKRGAFGSPNGHMTSIERLFQGAELQWNVIKEQAVTAAHDKSIIV